MMKAQVLCYNTLAITSQSLWFEKVLLYTLDRTDTLTTKFCHIPNGVTFVQISDNILVFFLFLFLRLDKPGLQPTFPPFSLYWLQPDCSRKVMLSRSNCAQVDSVAIIIGAKTDGFPSSPNNAISSYCVVALRHYLSILTIGIQNYSGCNTPY